MIVYVYLYVLFRLLGFGQWFFSATRISDPFFIKHGSHKGTTSRSSFPNCELLSYFKDEFHFLFLCSRLFFIADLGEEQPILLFFIFYDLMW